MIVDREFALSVINHSSGLVVDTRGPQDFERRHYPDAVNARTRQELLRLPKDRPLIVYCTCLRDGKAIKSARTLVDNGYPQVFVIKGGMYALLGEEPPDEPVMEQGQEQEQGAFTPVFSVQE